MGGSFVRVVMWSFLGLCLYSQSVWGGTIAGTVKNRVGTGVQDAVVYLEHAPGTTTPSEKPHKMNQKEMTFIPHVIPVLNGESVTFKNNDSVMHNVRAFLGRRSIFNVGIPAGGKDVTKQFNKLGDVAILCNVHPEMSAWVIVLENPYFALTDSAGQYEISNAPAGTYTLKTWHEKLKSQDQEVSVSGIGAAKVDLTLSE